MEMQLNRYPQKAESFPELVFKKPLIFRRDEFGVIGKENEPRWSGGDLIHKFQ